MKLKSVATKKNVMKFLRDWGPTIGQLAIMAGIALSADPAMANTSNFNAGEIKSSGLTTITGPLQTIRDTMTGPVASAITTVGAVVFGASWAANIDSQVTKGAMRVAGGSAVALGGAQLIGDVNSLTF